MTYSNVLRSQPLTYYNSNQYGCYNNQENSTEYASRKRKSSEIDSQQYSEKGGVAGSGIAPSYEYGTTGFVRS